MTWKEELKFRVQFAISTAFTELRGLARSLQTLRQ